ncbi:MAG: hypothetical protein A2939_00365 [Parcubacteria group bacterium RIFCSPLOWO2_01_FULL_48_18]|nr:MAG: hypothetical protein A2939_00365 [Parcubacteria group bacterium RIFCSPLOWO2_01_FULL_48_18]
MKEGNRNEQAKNLEIMAIKLEDFIANYTPAGWVEPIGKVMHRFIFLPKDTGKMEQDFKSGTLKDRLDKQYENPNVVMAIMDFFEKQE